MTQRKSTANYLICMAINIFCQSVLDMIFFSPEREKKKRRICSKQDKKPHFEDKEKVMNLQQGHIIMQ